MTIAILGAGVGGLSVAIALRQAGYEADIYERHPGMSEIGAGIVCWPNASFVLQKLGALQAVSELGGRVEAMNRVTQHGEALGSLSILKVNALMGYPSFSILRRDLMAILTQRLEALGGRVHYGHEVNALVKTGRQGAEMRFENGQSRQADIILGVDGRMKSQARAYVIGHNKPIYQRFINWVALFESEEPVFFELSVTDYWGVGERFGIVPVSEYKAYWAGGLYSEQLGTREPEQYKEELKGRFSKWPSPILQLIDQTPTERINKIYVYDHDPIQNWYRDNVLLLGDAAHASLPTSGQGACQALEDAWFFAKCLSNSPSDLPYVFASFVKGRIGKTRAITLAGRNLAQSIFNPHREHCERRNLAAKGADYEASTSAMAKL